MVATILSVLSLVAPAHQRSVYIVPPHHGITVTHQCNGPSQYWRRQDVFASGRHLRVHWNRDHTLEYWNAYRQTAATFDGITFLNDSEHTMVFEGTC